MLRYIFAVTAWSLLTAVAAAEIDSSTKQVIDFTQPEEAAKMATWSDPKNLGCTKEGFGWDGEKRASRDGWIETEPLAIGLASRPPQNANIRIKLETSYPQVEAPTKNSKIINTPSIFVRHSTDRVHWSDWQPADMREDPRAVGTVVYSTQMGIPRRTIQVYQAKLYEWSKRADTNHGSDEDEFSRWLVKHEPDYFAKERPFVGYVQFLVDGSFRGGQRLTRFEADVGWVVSGINLPPKETAVMLQGGKTGAWSFRGGQAGEGKE